MLLLLRSYAKREFWEPTELSPIRHSVSLIHRPRLPSFACAELGAAGQIRTELSLHSRKTSAEPGTYLLNAPYTTKRDTASKLTRINPFVHTNVCRPRLAQPLHHQSISYWTSVQQTAGGQSVHAWWDWNVKHLFGYICVTGATVKIPIHASFPHRSALSIRPIETV